MSRAGPGTMRELSLIEKKIINKISGGIEISRRPYQTVADAAGTSEDEVLETLNTLVKEKKIRRVCAILRQRELGYGANAMCVFDVAPENIDAAGEFASSFEQVSHCYKRPRSDKWPFNLYAMIHGRSKDDCATTAARIALFSGAVSYKMLYSVKELKKENMTYFD